MQLFRWTDIQISQMQMHMFLLNMQVFVFWVTDYSQSTFRVGADSLHEPCLYLVYHPYSVVS